MQSYMIAQSSIADWIGETVYLRIVDDQKEAGSIYFRRRTPHPTPLPTPLPTPSRMLSGEDGGSRLLDEEQGFSGAARTAPHHANARVSFRDFGYLDTGRRSESDVIVLELRADDAEVDDAELDDAELDDAELNELGDLLLQTAQEGGLPEPAASRCAALELRCRVLREAGRW